MANSFLFTSHLLHVEAANPRCGSREREMKKVKNGKRGLREEKEQRKRGAARLYAGFFKKKIIKADWKRERKQ